MTSSNAPIAENNIEKDKLKAAEIKNQLDYVLQGLQTIETLYKSNVTWIDELKSGNKGVSTGPWKRRSVVYGVDTSVGTIQTGVGKDHIFKYIFEVPMSWAYNHPNEATRAAIPTTIANIRPQDYSVIFSEASIQDLQDIRVSLGQAQTNLDGFNVAQFQEALNKVKRTITQSLFEDVKVFRDIINVIESEIRNSNSIIYKGEGSYGTFSNNELNSFILPEELLQVRDSCDNLLSEIRNLFVQVDKLINIPEDVLIRANLSNLGLTQSSSDPNVYNTLNIEEKDPWGIRFSYLKSVTSQVFAQEAVNNSNPNIPPSFIPSSNTLNNTIVNQKRDFYFQLLPAIKSNLPVSGGTDVPGAMPGIQFRIENNIVKHKIPGFAPIYQPIGIDSIKCTLVGLFTGNDGVDISSTFSDDTNTGLLIEKETLGESSLFKKINTGTYNKSPENLTTNNSAIKADSSDLPIPSASKNATSNNIAILSEDAFRGAQDFYNEIVLSGREVEVELNLRKGTGPYPGGSAGPFRDPDTGNPKFKGLIKRLDLYYVRRDRCWFIIDLEITNSGLIGSECLNLTNVIEEATELFEAIPEEQAGLTKKELDDCFKDAGGNVKTIIYKNTKSGTALQLSLDTGLSYEYNTETNKLLTEKKYPLDTRDTLNLLSRDYKNFEKSFFNGNSKGGVALGYIVQIFNNATDKIQTNPDGDRKFAANKVRSTEGSDFAYDLSSGNFYRVDDKLNIQKNRSIAGPLSKAIEYINTSVVFSAVIEESINFFLNDYLPLITFKPNNCERRIKEKNEAENVRTSNTNNVSNPGSELDSSLNSAASNNNINKVNLETSTFYKEGNEEELQTLETRIKNGEFDVFCAGVMQQYFDMVQTGKTNYNYFTEEDKNSYINDVNTKAIYIEPINTKILSTVRNKAVLKGEQSSNLITIQIPYSVNTDYTLHYNNSNARAFASKIYNANIQIKTFINKSTNEKIYKATTVYPNLDKL